MGPLSSLSLTPCVGVFYLSKHLDEHRLADKLGSCVGLGLHRDGDVSENQWPDGNEDRRPALTPQEHTADAGHGQLLVVREDELEGVTLRHDHHDLPTETEERTRPDRMKPSSEDT